MKASSKRLLDEQEINFCLNWVATGCDPEQLGFAAKLANPDTSRRSYIAQARYYLENPAVNDYIAELLEPPVEAAKRKLIEQVQTGEGTTATRAAERIFELEDKLGARDDVTYWAQVMCEVGADVVVPLPGACHECGAPYRATVPLVELFPQFKESA
jgi:hypothetical protein